jgi:hypothetical protein
MSSKEAWVRFNIPALLVVLVVAMALGFIGGLLLGHADGVNDGWTQAAQAFRHDGDFKSP